MRGTWSVRISSCIALLFVLVLGPLARATNVTVDCNKKKSINVALATLSKQGPHTVTVSGTCNEAVLIEDFSNLTLKGNPGASINDSTPSVVDDNDVIDISRSQNVTVRDLTVNGGFDGIACFQFSNCYLLNLTIQGGLEGIAFARSSGFVGDGTIIQNNAQGGMSVVQGSHVRVGPYLTTSGVMIQTNGNATDGGQGIFVNHNSYLDLIQSTVQDHDFDAGVSVSFGSFARILGSTITGNAGPGVAVSASVVRVQNFFADPTPIPSVITSNGGDGISLDHLSFLQINGSRNITGNNTVDAGFDVNCRVETAKTRGTGGSANPNLLVPGTPPNGTTNCTEPAP